MQNQPTVTKSDLKNMQTMHAQFAPTTNLKLGYVMWSEYVPHLIYYHKPKIL